MDSQHLPLTAPLPLAPALTSTKELMMESQWISKLCGRNEYCAYRLMRSERGVEVSSHLTEYENSILRTFWPRSTRCSGSAETLTWAGVGVGVGQGQGRSGLG